LTVVTVLTIVTAVSVLLYPSLLKSMDFIMDKTTEMDPVELGTIEIGSNEMEGQEEAVTAVSQVPAEEQLQDGGTDLLMSLPMAELQAEPEQAEQEQTEQKQEKQAEQAEEEEEEEEEQDGGGRDEDISQFYTDRKRYVLGTFKYKDMMVDKLLKETGKDPLKERVLSGSEGKGKKKKAKEDYLIPVTGPYFIVVKDIKEGVEGIGKELLYFPEFSVYTPTGDLQLTKRSFREATIEIPNYRPYTKDELFANFDKPDKAIKEAQINYNTAHKNMLVALKEQGHPNLKNRMNELYEADELLSMTRFATRLVYKEIGIPLNTLLFDQSKNKEIMSVIGRFMGFKIPMEKRYVTAAQVPNEASESENSTTPVIVINGPNGENGILSPFFQTPTTIMIEDIGYSCVYKGMLSLLVPELGPAKDHYIDDMAPFDNPDDLKKYDAYIREGENEIEVEKKLSKIIPEVYQAALQQNPTMANTLKATGDALLVVVPQENILDPFLGVGIDPNQTQLIKNPRKWTGQNMYGKVLMDLRQALRQASVSQQGPVLEGSILLEEEDGEIGEGSIPLDEEEEEEEEEVPKIVLEGEEEEVPPNALEGEETKTL